MQLFNQLNCRKVSVSDIQIFEGIFQNWFFIVVLLIEFVLQFLWIQVFFWLTRSSQLSMTEWGTCWVLGMTSLLIAFILKLTPKSLLKKFKGIKFINENNDKFDESRVNKFFDSVANKSVDAGKFF